MGAFGPSYRWAYLFHPPADRSFQLPPEVEELVAWGGGLLLPHFPLQNAAPLQLHTPGMCCHSPPHKDFEPFVGGRAQVLPPNIRSYSSSNRRRNNSRFSSSSRVRIMWNVVCSCWGNPDPWACSHGATAHQLAALLHHTHTQVSGMTSHRRGVQCLQALCIVVTSYHITYSHPNTHTQLQRACS